MRRQYWKLIGPKSYLDWLEIVGCAFSLLSFRARPTIFRWISILLFVGTFLETVWVPYLKYVGIEKNILYYNIFGFIEIGIWSGIFVSLMHRKRAKRMIIWGMVFCFAIQIYDHSVVYGWADMQRTSFHLCNVFMILVSLLFFYEGLKKEFYEPLTDPAFWMATGLFFYQSTLFVVETVDEFPDFYNMTNAWAYLEIVQNTGNTFYYLLLSLAFCLCYYQSSRRVT